MTRSMRELRDTRTVWLSRVTRASLLAVACFLSACGFHLRAPADAQLPPGLSILRVNVADRMAYPPLKVAMRNALIESGVRVDDGNALAPVLNLYGEGFEQRVLAVDTLGRVSDYLLSYRVSFTLADAAGKTLLQGQTVKLQREYRFDRLQVLGMQHEQDYLSTKMREDAVQQILRQLAAYRPKT